MLATKPVDVIVFFLSSTAFILLVLHLYFMVRNLNICVRIAHDSTSTYVINTNTTQMGPKSRNKTGRTK